MAGKRKGKPKDKKPKNYESKFNDKCIDLKRFAYDIINYSALKFRVPENCIAVYEGSHNDYGCDDFLPSVGRLIVECQIAHRFQFYEDFNRYCKSKPLESDSDIAMLMQEVIRETIEESPVAVDKVELSLAVVCELFIFLYSRNVSLNPKRLAKCWFQCYLNVDKKNFEAAGGMNRLYEEGNIEGFAALDSFVDDFVVENCLDYEESAKDPDVGDLYFLLLKGKVNLPEDLPKNELEDIEKSIQYMNEIQKLKSMATNVKQRKAVKPPELDAASGIDAPADADHRVIPHDSVIFHHHDATAEPTQVPSAATAAPEEQPRQHKPLSRKELLRMKNADLRARAERDLRRARLSRQRHPSVSTATAATTQLYEGGGARPKIRMPAAEDPMSRLGLEQGVEQLTIHSSDSE